MNDKILQVTDLKKYYGPVRAVDGVSFCVERGTTMGLVGESGCGKSTTGRLALRLAGEKTGGQVLFNGQDIYALSPKKLRSLRPKMQIIFQDPFSSLSPRMSVGRIIGEGALVHKLVPPKELDGYVDSIMEQCGLQPHHKNRYPHQFSGGQRQRICIARALAMQPEFMVCDEAVSALDVSVQAQIVNLLQGLQEKKGLSYLFISHDLSVVEHICHTVGVMYLGKMVEYAPTDALFSQPLHPYTRALLSAIPMPDLDVKMERSALRGSLPSPADPPAGCPFHTRCPQAKKRCAEEKPAWQEVAPDHFCACHLYNEKGTA